MKNVMKIVRDRTFWWGYCNQLHYFWGYPTQHRGGGISKVWNLWFSKIIFHSFLLHSYLLKAWLLLSWLTYHSSVSSENHTQVKFCNININLKTLHLLHIYSRGRHHFCLSFPQPGQSNRSNHYRNTSSTFPVGKPTHLDGLLTLLVMVFPLFVTWCD